GGEDDHAHLATVWLAVRLCDHGEQFAHRAGNEFDRDLFARFASGGIRGRFTGIEFAAGEIDDVASASGDHEHPPVADQGDCSDEDVGERAHAVRSLPKDAAASSAPGASPAPRMAS